MDENKDAILSKSRHLPNEFVVMDWNKYKLKSSLYITTLDELRRRKNGRRARRGRMEGEPEEQEWKES